MKSCPSKVSLSEILSMLQMGVVVSELGSSWSEIKRLAPDPFLVSFNYLISLCDNQVYLVVYPECDIIHVRTYSYYCIISQLSNKHCQCQ